MYDHSDNIVTQEVDAAEEIAHVNHALGACGYPSWSFKIVREQLDQRELKKNLKINKNKVNRRAPRAELLCLMSGVFQRLEARSAAAMGLRH